MAPTMDAHGWDRAYAERKRPGSTEPRPVVVELASPLAPGRALDLGAGEGRNAIWLAGRGWRVTAVDFSRVALEGAARRADQAAVAPGLEYVVADVCHFVPGAAAFDLVLISYVHPEPPDRDAMLAAAAGAVAPGGRLLVLGLGLPGEGAEAGAGADVAGGLPRAGGGPDPERRYTPERIAGAFPGIELDRCDRVTYEVETADGPRQAVDVVAWGRRPPLQTRDVPGPQGVG